LINNQFIFDKTGYVYSLDTPTHIKADIPVKDPSSGKEENATLVLTRIGYSSNSIHLFGRPSESNLHHFQSISVIKSIRFGIGISAPKWFRRMNARGISTRLVSKHIHGPDVQLVLAPTGWKNEHIELEMGAIKRRLVWSGQNKLPCKKKMHDRFDEMMDSAILF
jgi:hypothetical protein